MDATVPEVDPQAPLQDNEGLVRVFVIVPDEIALELHDLELIVVHFSDDLRLPLLVEQPEFLLEVDRSVVHCASVTPLRSGLCLSADSGRTTRRCPAYRARRAPAMRS